MKAQDHEHQAQQHDHHYRRLALMSVLSFGAMYGLMYAMVDTFGNVYANVNQFYMAALMAAPMVILELILMGMMYTNKRRNALVMGLSVVVLAGSWFGIRQQALVSDRQFLRSMIPHHAGALLMCGKAKLQDPEIVELCRTILAGQQAEIDQMNSILDRLE